MKKIITLAAIALYSLNSKAEQREAGQIVSIAPAFSARSLFSQAIPQARHECQDYHQGCNDVLVCCGDLQCVDEGDGFGPACN